MDELVEVRHDGDRGGEPAEAEDDGADDPGRTEAGDGNVGESERIGEDADADGDCGEDVCSVEAHESIAAAIASTSASDGGRRSSGHARCGTAWHDNPTRPSAAARRPHEPAADLRFR